jgi:cysteinyl-tRNA synthetase
MYMKMQQSISSKISRLALLVSEYNIEVSYFKDALNIAADGLSRMHQLQNKPSHKYKKEHASSLDNLQAPTLPPQRSIPLPTYLTMCDATLSQATINALTTDSTALNKHQSKGSFPANSQNIRPTNLSAVYPRYPAHMQTIYPCHAALQPRHDHIQQRAPPHKT